MSDSTWYREEDELLHALRSDKAPNSIPSLSGYDDWQLVARGGQGQVYRATQTSTRREVAIKVLYEGTENLVDRRARFEREIELAGALQHPNIVRIYDGGVLPDGRLFAVMEFIDGIPLDRFVMDHALDTEQLIELFLQVCDAIRFAHRRGVIHRDVKPSNILVTSDGVPQVLDFGIARLIGQVGSSTKTGQFVGTIAYASPEQIGGDPLLIDIRTDIYSLGVVLYRLLTNDSPYPVDGPIGEIVESIRSTDPTPPSRLTAKSDRELDAVVLRALEKDPEDRYSNVDALANDLRRYLAGEPLEAKRHRKWYVLGKTIRKHRVTFSAAALLLLLLIVFSGTVTTLWQRAVAVEQRAREVNVFWEDTLSSVSPSREGQPITFRDVLDEAVHWVAITTEGEPEIEAALRTTIGNGYRNLELYELADRQLSRALQIRREVFSKDHREVAQSLNSLALLRKSQGRTDQAKELFLQVLEMRRRQLGANHPEVAMSLQNLGRLAMDENQLSQAEDYFEKSLEVREKNFAADDPAIATVLFDQGQLAMQREDWNLAESCHGRALAIRQARLAPTHPDIARSLVSVSRALHASGDSSLALQYAQQARKLQLMRLDPQHPSVRKTDELISAIDDNN